MCGTTFALTMPAACGTGGLCWPWVGPPLLPPIAEAQAAGAHRGPQAGSQGTEAQGACSHHQRNRCAATRPQAHSMLGSSSVTPTISYFTHAHFYTK